MFRDPYLHAAPAKTADDAEPSVVAADDERAGITRRAVVGHRPQRVAIVRPA